MLNNEADACTATMLSAPVARTSSFGSAWIDVRDYEGAIMFTLMVGTVSGTSPTLDVAIRDSDNSGGTGSANVRTFTQITSGTQTQKIVIPAGEVRGWVQVNATIGGTTPSFTMAVAMHGRPKIV